MNTYPAELVAQLPPCMHASGLVRRSADAPRSEPLRAFDDVPAPVDVYPELAAALAAAHERHARLRIWAPPDHQRFRTVLVEHGHRLPLTKVTARAKDEAGQRALAALPPRSPLSPLLPGGPLFPDGIIAPSWIRKHIEYLPAVYVAYVCMSDAGGDDAIITALSKLRASIAHRGTRLVAVLVCAHPSVATDARVADIRRAVQLDARAGVFVVSPGVDPEAFCALLDTALLDGAHEYYWDRSWRVRRNRARYPPPPSIAQPIIAAASAAGLLGAHSALLAGEGWNVRALYKLAALAELQGTAGDVLPLYSEAYEQLVTACLANTGVLAPRTRRWAEAKVLADTVSFKICKYHLYRADSAAAVAQFRRHTRRFTELSAGWGIGTSTPDYWAWMAKQLQLMGDLVSVAGIPDATTGAGAGMLAPTTLLQPAGSYYYLAALATLERAARSEATADHVAAASEHFGAAYDGLRKIGRPRLALLAATRIGLVYQATGAPDRASRFLERALRTYRQDGFTVPHALLARMAAPAAAARGDAETAARILADARASAHAVGSKDVLDASSRITVAAVFFREKASIGEYVPFQVRVRSRDVNVLALTVYDSSGAVLELTPGDGQWVTLEPMCVGASVSAQARLSGAVVAGALSSETPRTVRLGRAVAQVLIGNSVVPVELAVCAAPTWAARAGVRAVKVDHAHPADARSIEFRREPRLDITPHDTALCGEVLPLHVGLHDAPGCDILVALSDASRASGARFADSGDAYLVAPGDALDVRIQVPQAPSLLSLLVRALQPSDTPLLLTEREQRVRIIAPFSVRAALHWAPAQRNTPRTGHITLHVRQIADCALELLDVCVLAAEASAVRAGAALPLDAVRGEWLPGDSGVLTCALSLADPNEPRDAPPVPHVALTWKKPGGVASCTRVTLMPLEPALPSEVVIDVVGPARAAVHTPFPLYIGMRNLSETRTADVHLELRYALQDYTISGPPRRMVEGLEPGEARTLTVRAVPRAVSPAVPLPRVFAWEDAMQGGLPVETPVPVTGRPASVHVVPVD